MANSKLLINRIRLLNFRRFENFDCKINSRMTIFVGNNACGKTTILEAIYLGGIAKSFKTNIDTELIHKGSPYSVVEINQMYKVVLSEQGKTTLINNVEKKKLSDYMGVYHVIVFSPEDLNLVKGSPILRRRFMDIEIGQTNKEYLSLLLRYKKILKERNDCLKKMDIDLTYLNILTEEIGKLNDLIKVKRNDFISEINIYANKITQLISKEKLEIKYMPSIPIDASTFLKSKIELDVKNHNTSYGIHRDDLLFYLNGIESVYCSQGQIRTMVLSLKLSLIEYIKKHTSLEPIILLDDVFSELDDQRQKELMDVVRNYQTFITSTNISVIKNKIEDSNVFLFKENEIKELK